MIQLVSNQQSHSAKLLLAQGWRQLLLDRLRPDLDGDQRGVGEARDSTAGAIARGPRGSGNVGLGTAAGLGSVRVAARSTGSGEQATGSNSAGARKGGEGLAFGWAGRWRRRGVRGYNCGVMMGT